MKIATFISRFSISKLLTKRCIAEKGKFAGELRQRTRNCTEIKEKKLFILNEYIFYGPLDNGTFTVPIDSNYLPSAKLAFVSMFIIYSNFIIFIILIKGSKL